MEIIILCYLFDLCVGIINNIFILYLFVYKLYNWDLKWRYIIFYGLLYKNEDKLWLIICVVVIDFCLLYDWYLFFYIR